MTIPVNAFQKKFYVPPSAVRQQTRRGTKKGRNKKQMKQKRISRTYRISVLTDRLVKAVAVETGNSEASVLEYCVLDRVEHMIGRYKLLDRLVSEEQLPTNIRHLVQEARTELCNRWQAENQQAHLKSQKDTGKK